MEETAAGGPTATTEVRTTAKRLARRYWLLLLAVAVLATIDQALVQPLLVRLSGHAPVINLAGRQRMLSQQLAKAAIALLVETDGSAAARQRALQAAASQWSEAHERLTSGRAGPDLPADDAARIADEYGRLEPHFTAMCAAADQLARLSEGDATDGSSSPADRPEARILVRTILDHADAYLPIMDGIVAQYEEASQRQLARLRLLGLGIMLTVWLAVVALGAFVLRPAQHIIARQLAWLAESEARLRRARDELEVRVADRTRQLVMRTEALQREMAERRRAESRSRELAAQLSHASRVTALGQLATGLAHELNQPMAAITNYAETAALLLAEQDADASPLAQAVQRIRQTALRAGQLVDRMRRFLRPAQSLRQPASLAALVRDVCELCRAGSAVGDIDVRVDIAGDLPDVLVDSIQIQQVLVNLIQNALQAMHSAGRHDGQCRVRAWTDGQERCVVEVSDDGPGFPDDIDPDDLTPFSTTKPHGLGMGLAISRSIVEQHGGRLQAESAPGQGATVSFTLPLASAPHEGVEHAADGLCR